MRTFISVNDKFSEYKEINSYKEYLKVVFNYKLTSFNNITFSKPDSKLLKDNDMLDFNYGGN